MLLISKNIFPTHYLDVMSILNVEICSCMQQKNESCFHIFFSISMSFLLGNWDHWYWEISIINDCLPLLFCCWWWWLCGGSVVCVHMHVYIYVCVFPQFFSLILELIWEFYFLCFHGCSYSLVGAAFVASSIGLGCWIDIT